MTIPLASDWPVITWIISAVLGMSVSARGFVYAYQDWRQLRAMSVRDSLMVTAWMYVRSHMMYFGVHALFFLVGVDALWQPLPPRIDMLATVVALVGATYVLVLLSFLGHNDRLRATRLAREGR